MKKVFRKIHLWLSVPFGLLITLICFSGAMLVFETEVMEFCRRDLYYVEKVGPAPLPMGKVAEKVAATLPDSVSVTGVTASSAPEHAWQVNLSKPRRASVYVDQYTGEIKGKYERAPFFMTMFRLHRWLLDSMKPDGGIFWGKMIVGTATLMFVFVLISGIVIWWPRTKKALKNSLKIVAGKGWRRFCYDLHVAGGMYTLVLLLVMALTGLTWSFSWYRTGFYKVFGVETTQGGGGHGAPAQTAAHSPFTNWQKVYEELKELNPDYKQITVSKGSATVSFNRLGNQRATDRYTFNPRSGEITGATLYEDADASGKIRGWIFSVHVGSWGGLTTRILSFLAALVGASLPLTGYYLWIRRLVRKGSRKANMQLKKVA
ncbi:MAG: PepSY-associated TM helix domain-containing protein [Bacteroides sp.]|uniref:PepSY-associated TM helix domain-containing protein n=1 Tax=Bacteroides sp. TaxID=29523 RepID=UPI0026DFAC33|nr:PepSY-associated TM helix domain-containing protein [Bacteroides sp.]MDO5421013.1 PepSY-associated TM helix domain-containing protein [Bacteroides sp.]